MLGDGINFRQLHRTLVMCEPKKFYAILRERCTSFQGDCTYETRESAVNAAERLAHGWNERVYVVEAIESVEPQSRPVIRKKL